MKLKYVSITGADDEVNISDLNAIAEQYPFVEWAILLLPEQAGQNRFPSENWISNFVENYKGVHKAMHLCGSAFLGFIDNSSLILDMMKGFDRIQLNLEFGVVKKKYDFQDLITQIKKHPEFEFVIQYTDENKYLLPYVRDIPNHVLLFDTSAGRGVSPDNWPAPIENHRCGYAGGINPDNVQQHINAIIKAVGDYETWIDMETGIRTNDKFDLEKVQQVLEISKSHTHKKIHNLKGN